MAHKASKTASKRQHKGREVRLYLPLAGEDGLWAILGAVGDAVVVVVVDRCAMSAVLSVLHGQQLTQVAMVAAVVDHCVLGRDRVGAVPQFVVQRREEITNVDSTEDERQTNDTQDEFRACVPKKS